MKNILISGGILLVLILLGLITWTLFGSKEEVVVVDPVTQDQFPISADIPRDDATSITISTAKGELLPVKNFFTDGETVPDPTNKGYYHLGNHFPFDSDMASTAPAIPYTITFIESTQFFNIGLYEEPISEARLEAEQYLRDHLGVTKEQMCDLNYVVSVPNFVSPLFAGDSLGFSFCPGAIEI